jgi:aminomethyltransferase
MKNTPFTQKHITLGAKMAQFAGYNMPISYSGINDEHAAVRNSVGVFDVSHMGEFILKGEKALDLIQRVTTNDASKLTSGKAQYSSLTNNEGGIVDDLIVYCIEENKVYMLVVNAGNIEKDWNWITQHNTENADMHNISDKTCLLAVQGPNATKILQPLIDTDILNLKYYTFIKGKFAGVDNVLISATGYTGAGGVEIYFEDKMMMPIKYGMPFSMPASHQTLNRWAWGQEIHCVWKWVIVYMGMILMIQPHRWKQVWVG